MQDHDFRIELFVFPDGTEIEMLVFEPTSLETTEGGRRRAGREHEDLLDRAARAAEDDVACAPHGPACHDEDSPARAAFAAPHEGELPPETDAPHSCPICGSELVYPVDWRRADDVSWLLRLRCPECETERDVTLGRTAVEDFNRRLYYGSQELAQAANEMSRRNFEEEAAKLVAALELDLILPMDF